MTIWFSSDLHLDHTNIIEYCDRPFRNAREMNEILLYNHNSLVKPSDHWYNLGDVTMRRGGKDDRDWFINTMKRFNGHKRLILGNHDHLPIKTYAEVFEKVVGTGRWIEGLLLSHYPVHPESMGNAPANVHGHVHNNQNNVFKSIVRDGVIKPYINVSIEVIDYKPVSLEEVQQMVRRAIG